MTQTANAIVSGILAGIASAILAGSVLTQTILAVLLFHLSAFPIIVAGLMQGVTASVIASAVAGVLVGLVVGVSPAIVVLLTAALPAALATGLVSLARPADEIGGTAGDMVWFPLADVMFYGALAIAAGFVILGAHVGYGPEFSTEFALAFAQQMAEVNPQFAPSAEFAPSLAAFLHRAVPLVLPGMMVMALAGALYLALAAVRSSGRFARPRDFWPRALRMPKTAMPAFAVALLVSFLSSPAGLAGTVFCGAIGTGFAMAGVAMLHERTAGKPMRGLVLTLAYFALFLFLPAILMFLAIGLFDTSRAAPVSRGPNSTLH